MRIEQEKIPNAEAFLKDKFKGIYSKQSKGLTDNLSENRYFELHVTGRIDGREQNYPEMMEEYLKMHLKAIRYEYDQYQFFLDGYRNGSASTSEVTEAHDRFLKLLEQL